VEETLEALAHQTALPTNVSNYTGIEVARKQNQEKNERALFFLPLLPQINTKPTKNNRQNG
jgi:hypothetical protein